MLIKINRVALMNNTHEKFYALADDLDERAEALQRHARDLRQHAHLLEDKINERRRHFILAGARSGRQGNPLSSPGLPTFSGPQVHSDGRLTLVGCKQPK